MDAILAELSKYGLSGVIVALLAYDAFFLQRKLMQIIEANTTAMTKMADLLQKCQDRCQK